MKKIIYCIISLIVAGATLSVNAEPVDTVMVYKSWDAIFDALPDTMLVSPEIEVRSPYDFDFKSTVRGDKVTKKMLRDSTIAVTIGDSIWLISSNYIKRNFTGDVRDFDRFVPMYFNSKALFIQYIDIAAYLNNDMLMRMFYQGYTMEEIYAEIEQVAGAAPFYLVDFSGKTVYRVDNALLTQLLDDYPDLLRRYSQMRDYRETYMINTFFLEYVNRLEQDREAPFLDPF